MLRLAVVCLLAGLAFAGPRPAQERSPLSAVGRGVAIVFSPDLSVGDTCAFYERLGFTCYDSASWETVVEDIRCRNASAPPEEAISVVILEAHGTNGNGLRLQVSSAKKASRSYAAIGALTERFATAGVRYCVLAACNSRRLLRPAIYHKLDPSRLYLPATLGILNAQDEVEEPGVRLLARADSHIESVSLGTTRELSAATLRALDLREGEAMSFVVSDMLVQLMTRDPSLDLRPATPVHKLKLATPEDEYAEDLFARFVEHLDRLSTSSEDVAPAPLVATLSREHDPSPGLRPPSPHAVGSGAGGEGASNSIR
ncbi:MAG TPA: hypothetical protein VHL59_18195 [Thermoanaerobaculia bacterium]|nr:hypothetical protein [Thermoanaerobaculia bacterium]